MELRYRMIMKKTLLLSLLISTIFVLSLCLIFSGVYNKPNDIDDAIYKQQISDLNKKNDSLKLSMEKKIDEIKTMQFKIDSLTNLKSQIQIRYVEKIKEIENANAIDVYNDFKRIFSNNNIK